MIPTTVSDDLTQDFEYKDTETKTYKLNLSTQTISGFVDKIEAMKQAVYLILNTERYENLIYSWNYGVELKDLFGKDINYALPEIKRRITEALLQDSRISSVENFIFSHSRGVVAVEFTVVTIYGEFETESVVNI